MVVCHWLDRRGMTIFGSSHFSVTVVSRIEFFSRCIFCWLQVERQHISRSFCSLGYHMVSGTSKGPIGKQSCGVNLESLLSVIAWNWYNVREQRLCKAAQAKIKSSYPNKSLLLINFQTTHHLFSEHFQSFRCGHIEDHLHHNGSGIKEKL